MLSDDQTTMAGMEIVLRAAESDADSAESDGETKICNICTMEDVSRSLSCSSIYLLQHLGVTLDTRFS